MLAVEKIEEVGNIASQQKAAKYQKIICGFYYLFRVENKISLSFGNFKKTSFSTVGYDSIPAIQAAEYNAGKALLLLLPWEI